MELRWKISLCFNFLCFCTWYRSWKLSIYLVLIVHMMHGAAYRQKHVVHLHRVSQSEKNFNLSRKCQRWPFTLSGVSVSCLCNNQNPNRNFRCRCLLKAVKFQLTSLQVIEKKTDQVVQHSWCVLMLFWVIKFAVSFTFTKFHTLLQLCCTVIFEGHRFINSRDGTGGEVGG